MFRSWPMLAFGCFAAVLAGTVAFLTRPMEAPPALPETNAGKRAAPIAPAPPGFVGVVVNSSTINLTPLQEGAISTITARVGDSVKRGQVLVTFENAELRQEVAMAEAQMARDDADIERAVLERRQAAERLARAEAAKQHLNVDELSTAQYGAGFAATNERALRAKRAQDLARLEQLRERLSQRTLRAPFDGVVSDRFLDPGASVSVGTVILRLVGQVGWRVRFAIPEEVDRELALSTDAGVEVVSSSGERWPGVVTEMAPGVDPASLTRFAEAELLIEHGGPAFGARVRVSPRGRP